MATQLSLSLSLSLSLTGREGSAAALGLGKPDPGSTLENYSSEEPSSVLGPKITIRPTHIFAAGIHAGRG